MNPEQKELAEKVLSIFKSSEKDTLYFPEDLSLIFTSENTAKLVTNNLIELGLLKLVDKGFFRITNKGLNFKGFKDLENKDKIENRKNVLDLLLKEWQVKTFWPVFTFAFFGFGFSVFNFINNQKNQDNVKLQEQRIEQMGLELTKLQTSILTQKSIDSLHNSKVLTTKIAKEE